MQRVIIYERYTLFIYYNLNNIPCALDDVRYEEKVYIC